MQNILIFRKTMCIFIALLILVSSLYFPATVLALPADVPVFERVWGSSGTGQSQFAEAIAVAVGENGRVYVSDRLNHRLQVFDSNGNYQFQIGTGTAGSGTNQFSGPQGLAIDFTNNWLYVVDSGNARVVKLDLNGNYISSFTETATSPGNGIWSNSHGIVVDQTNGNVYISVPGEARVDVHNSSGTFLFTLNNVYFPIPLNAPRSMVIKNDEIFISDQNSATGILVYDKNTGEVKRRYTITGSPRGLVMDYEGNLFVADRTNNRIRKYDSETGAALAVFGETGTGNNQYTGLYNIGIDRAGYTFYITDLAQNRVQKYTFTQLPITSQSLPGRSIPQPEACGESLSVAPDFFKVERTGATATLFFTPIANIQDYMLSYGDETATEGYGATFNVAWTDGVQQFTVEKLDPNKSYTFKLRGQKGCAPGPWSQQQNSIATKKLADTGAPTVPLSLIGIIGASVSITAMWVVSKRL